MSRALWLADHLRLWGFVVVEVAGWQERGAGDLIPRIVVDHHTAGPRLGNAPSLGVVTFGRPDLNGPLANVLTARDGTIYVVASGTSNNAGLGAWAGYSGNHWTLGNERENVGTDAEPFTAEQNAQAARLGACLLDGIERFHGHAADPLYFVEHKEYAANPPGWPGRKIDAWKTIPSAMRASVSHELAVGPNPTPPPPIPEPEPPTEEDEDMPGPNAEAQIAEELLEKWYPEIMGRPIDVPGRIFWLGRMISPDGGKTPPELTPKQVEDALYHSADAVAWRASHPGE